MDRTAKAIENHQNITITTNSVIASVALEKAGHKVAGVLVTPAVWALNYAANKAKPDELDVALYVTGFFGSIASVAAIGTGVVKAVVDDDTKRRLAEVQQSEGGKFSPFIKPCSNFSKLAGPQIIATSIASKGGTAWRHPNGLWVYITDIRGYLVHDYSPKRYVEIYQPKLPLNRGANGGFRWGVKR